MKTDALSPALKWRPCTSSDLYSFRVVRSIPPLQAQTSNLIEILAHPSNMVSSSTAFRPVVTVAVDRSLHSASGNTWESLEFSKPINLKSNRLFYEKRFKLNCCADNREMDVRTSALADDIVECLNEEEGMSEASISRMLMNFDNKFDRYRAISMPICQTATFKQLSAVENGPYDIYPKWESYSRCFGKLEKADRALCFTSGMAALSALTHLIGTDEEIIAGDDLYGGSDRLLSQVIPKTGVVVKRVNTSDLDEVKSAIGHWTKLVWLQSPTNPRLQISDIRKNSRDCSCTRCSCAGGQQYNVTCVVRAIGTWSRYCYALSYQIYCCT